MDALTQLLVLVTALLLGSSVAISLDDTPVQNFQKTCVKWATKGPAILVAVCPSMSGEQICSKLDLDLCMSVSWFGDRPFDFTMEGKDNGYISDHCVGCSIRNDQVLIPPDVDTQLKCECSRESVAEPWTGIVHMDPWIGNVDGYLKCYEHVGEKQDSCPI
ncbi:uncharacterized protein BCR38DRAFT_452993 [Pseudomassariella vexata]|uniref:Cyanovirin-N domain-containing protein n=1 Tax=Pseudomassariella vexata TaxID=1141098 RepID=A0A1Y2D6P4_9PEZI|nr:uncharacterized protein BCR38DRAFT_452993 [Pseudomassariella vexata]ORY54950.1 hypothetical protein BCR38DRAFT_452993 [Pseudomassariella vexata]